MLRTSRYGHVARLDQFTDAFWCCSSDCDPGCADPGHHRCYPRLLLLQTQGQRVRTVPLLYSSASELKFFQSWCGDCVLRIAWYFYCKLQGWI